MLDLTVSFYKEEMHCLSQLISAVSGKVLERLLYPESDVLSFMLLRVHLPEIGLSPKLEIILNGHRGKVCCY